MVGPDRVEMDTLLRMTRTLRHRGPDDEGFLVREYDDGVAVGLGFRRLSIVDLQSGNQPIGNESGAVQVVFNGEIYNFPTLRRELEERGHRFSTHADTEVIPHLYEELGPRCVERLNGMFAFALWDEARRELLLARDRFGKKPLYYAQVGRSLIFGSELKSLLEHPSCPSELDPEGLSRYLALEYVPTPYAIFTGVRKLPGGHVLRWRDGRVSVDRYWSLSFASGPSADDPDTDDEYAEELTARLREAVRRRLMSDVPLGAFLSGGIDSSSIVAMMVEAMPSRDVKTFSIGFGERSFDESEHARRVAEHFGTDHHEEVFTPRAMTDVLPSVVDVLDEPFADASILPTYVLSRFTRESVTVASAEMGATSCSPGTRRSRRSASRGSMRYRGSSTSAWSPLWSTGSRCRPRTSAPTSSSSGSCAERRLLRMFATRCGSARSLRPSRPRCSTGSLPIRSRSSAACSPRRRRGAGSSG